MNFAHPDSNVVSIELIGFSKGHIIFCATLDGENIYESSTAGDKAQLVKTPRNM